MTVTFIATSPLHFPSRLQSHPPYPNMSTQPLSNAVSEAISYASSHGIIVAQTKSDPIGTALTHAPITLAPSPVHSPSYHKALKITNPLNTLCTNIAADTPYLRATLSETANADSDFTGRLLHMLPEQPIGRVQLSIFRFDYFIHEEHTQRSLRMVEMNCIAASFACLGTRTAQMHRYLARHPACPRLDVERMPCNDAMGHLAHGIAVTITEYANVYGRRSARLVCVMVVQPGERNAYDQDLLRIAVLEKSGVEVVRLTLAQVAERGQLEEGRLLVELEEREEVVEVAVVYYRAGYTPDDYLTENEWEARSMMESSLAANCPTIAMQLVGTKKIQQVLDKAGEVEKFVGEKEAAEIRETFASQYSLSQGSETEDIVKMAIERPDDYVLKPQREGGGNNLYSKKLKDALQTMSASERAGYVLMERIRPVVVKNVVIRGGKHGVTDIVSELGVYGVHISRDGEVVENYTAGTLLRSKAASADDGGVAAGVAVLDSPILVE